MLVGCTEFVLEFQTDWRDPVRGLTDFIRLRELGVELVVERQQDRLHSPDLQATRRPGELT